MFSSDVLVAGDQAKEGNAFFFLSSAQIIIRLIRSTFTASPCRLTSSSEKKLPSLVFWCAFVPRPRLQSCELGIKERTEPSLRAFFFFFLPFSFNNKTVVKSPLV